MKRIDAYRFVLRGLLKGMRTTRPRSVEELMQSNGDCVLCGVSGDACEGCPADARDGFACGTLINAATKKAEIGVLAAGMYGWQIKIPPRQLRIVCVYLYQHVCPAMVKQHPSLRKEFRALPVVVGDQKKHQHLTGFRAKRHWCSIS